MFQRFRRSVRFRQSFLILELLSKTIVGIVSRINDAILPIASLKLSKLRKKDTMKIQKTIFGLRLFLDVIFLFFLSSYAFAATPTASITVATNSSHPRKSYVGFLFGDYGATDKQIMRLAPQYWREPAPSAFPRLKALGIESSKLFNYVEGDKVRAVTPKNTASYVRFIKKRYAEYAAAEQASGYKMKYWEFWNEAEGMYVWEPKVRGETVDKMERFYYAFKVFHDTIRSLRPDAKIVAPSSSHFWPGLMEDFFKRCSENKLKFEAVAWHVIGHRPEEIPDQVSFVRNLIKKYPSVGVKEIHLNEWGWANIGTGSQMSYFYYMDKAGVDLAAKSIFSASPLDNLFTYDGFRKGRPEYKAYAAGSKSLPRVSYWAWVFYAKMGLQGYDVTSSNPFVVCLAAPDRNTPDMTRIIVARATSTRLYTSDPKNLPARTCPVIPPPINISVDVTGLPDGEVQVEIISLPNTDWAMTEDVLRSFVSTSDKMVKDGKLKLEFSNVEEEKVFLVTILSKKSGGGS